MKAKKLLAGLLSAAMVLSSMALPVFADDSTSMSFDDFVAKIEAGESVGTDNGRITVEWSPVSGCGYTNHKKEGKCPDNYADATASTPEKINSKLAQFQFGGNATDIKIKNVDFKYVATNFAFCHQDRSAQATGSKTIDDAPSAQLHLYNSGNVTIEGCTFDNVVVTPWRISKDTVLNTRTVTVKNCTFKAVNSYGLKDVQAGNVIISNNNFENTKRGIMLSGATVLTSEIKGNTFNCFGEELDGDIIQIASSCLFDDSSKLEITDNTSNSDSPVFRFENSDVKGLVFKDNDIPTTASLTSGESKYRAAIDENGNVSCGIVKVGDKLYATLEEAAENMADGDTFELLGEAETDKEVSSGLITFANKSGNFDGHNYKLTGGICANNWEADSAYYGITIKNAKISATPFEVNGSMKRPCAVLGLLGAKVTVENGEFDADNIVLYATNGTTLNVKDGSFIVNEAENVCVYSEENSVINIYGGTFKGKDGIDVAAVAAADTGIINIYDGTFDGDIVVDGESDSGIGTINIYGGTFTGEILNGDAPELGQINITGGTFNQDVSEYTAEGYTAFKNADGTYTVQKSDLQVIPAAQVVSTTVTLEGLEDNLRKNNSDLFVPGEQAVFKTETSVPSAADQEKAADVSKAEGARREMYDIKVVKYVGGEAKGTVGVTNQTVTLTLGTPATINSTVKVIHIDNGTATEITGATLSDDGTTVTFIAPSFSTYVVDYEPGTVEDIATNINVSFSDPVIDGKTATFDLEINGETVDEVKKVINRFTSSEWTFDLTDGFAYEITPKMHVNMVENTADNTYEFNMDSKTYSDATGKKIALATVKVTGNGIFTFKADSAKVHATTSTDNIVNDFDSAATGDTGKVNVEATATGTLATKKFDLNVNIAFNNAVNDNEAAYQDMTVTISGGDLTDNLVYELGNDFVNDDNAALTYDAENSSYALKISNKLSENVAYTVKVEGAGYRTARYTVNMTGAKTLNFWNNVKDTAAYVEESVGTQKNTTFLAGDIVKDNQINIYDLSAVVSYFGTGNLVSEYSEYAKYDLNRDGKIDSKDIAYVLVSWGK